MKKSTIYDDADRLMAAGHIDDAEARGTERNWATVTKVAALAAALD